MFARPVARLLRPRLAAIPRLAPTRSLYYPHFKGPGRALGTYPGRAPQYPNKAASTFSDDRSQQFGAAILDTRNGVGELLHQVEVLNRTIREMKRNFVILAVMCTAGAVMIGALSGVILWVMIMEDVGEEEGRVR